MKYNKIWHLYTKLHLAYFRRPKDNNKGRENKISPLTILTLDKYIKINA